MTNQLSHANLFSDLSNVTLRRVFNTDQGWIMEAHGQNSAVCPGCQSISRSRHSRYWRSLKDLRQCPGFAVMRKLVLSFRAILRGGKVTTLHRWMEEARK